MDAEKTTPTSAASSSTLNPVDPFNIQVRMVSLENIPKLDPEALQSFLANASPDVAKYLSMCSEMLQVAMAATAQQRIGNAVDGSGPNVQPVGPPGNPDLPTQALKEGKGGGQPAEGADGKRIGGPPDPTPAKAAKTETR